MRSCIGGALEPALPSPSGMVKMITLKCFRFDKYF